MHNHFCKHCHIEFMCGEDAAECFADVIVCRNCFWSVEVKYFVWFLILALVAIGLTLFAAENFK